MFYLFNEFVPCYDISNINSLKTFYGVISRLVYVNSRRWFVIHLPVRL